jgi:undecaprenyl-diphosphatase
MLEALQHIDQALFLFFNVTLANPITDLIMPVVTNDNLLRIGYVIAMLLILWRGDKRLRWMVLASLVVLTLTDQTASKLLKPLIERPRPCHVMDQINLLVGCGGGFAMPSSHAANAMGQAFLFSCANRGLKWYLYVFAGIVAVSRVFVGVHYPGDVLVGSAVGATYGILVTWIFGRIDRRYISISESRNVIQDRGD